MRCATTKSERVLRGIISIIVGAFSLSLMDNLVLAIPTAVFSVLLMIGAFTGWCPTNLLVSRPWERRDPAEQNAFGIPEAPERITL